MDLADNLLLVPSSTPDPHSLPIRPSLSTPPVPVPPPLPLLSFPPSIPLPTFQPGTFVLPSGSTTLPRAPPPCPLPRVLDRTPFSHHTPNHPLSEFHQRPTSLSVYLRLSLPQQRLCLAGCVPPPLSVRMTGSLLVSSLSPSLEAEPLWFTRSHSQR